MAPKSYPGSGVFGRGCSDSVHLPDNRRGIGSLLSCHLLQPIEFIAERVSADYPREFNHIGDHIKAKRLDRSLTMKETIKILQIDDRTLRHWEAGRITKPSLRHWPKIIEFLEYCPYVPCHTVSAQCERWRKLRGLGSNEVAGMLGVDQRTYLNFVHHCQARGPVSASMEERCRALINQDWGE